MELEELRQQWQSLDEKLAQSLKLQRELLSQSAVPPIRRRIYALAIWRVLDIAFALTALLFIGSFVSAHSASWSLVVPSAIIMACAIALLIDSIRELNCVSTIDWGRSVVEIQSALSQLRIAKILQFKWIILLSPLVGFCGLIVGLQWLLDWLPEPHAILDKVNSWWVIGNYVLGVMFIPFGHLVVRLLARRFHGSGWWQQALDGISGTSLKKAQRELERWASVESETSSTID